MVKRLTAVVIDDEALNRAELNYLLSLYPDVEVVGEASDIASGWELIADKNPGLVFLDIQMDHESAGLELGLKLKRLPQPPRLIFVTGHPERALDGYDCHPDHFLVKPLSDAKLTAALQRARDALARTPRPVPRVPLPYLAKDRFGEIERVTAYAFPREIIFVRSSPGNSDGVSVCLGDKQLNDVRRTLSDLEAVLKPHRFFRSHKSFLINLARVTALKPRPGDELYKVALDGTDNEIPIARDRLPALRAALEMPLGWIAS
ncbi:MAG: LytTR family DNA-binding domain-containing protein [Methylococcaceae bacterium]|nr:LytTR family DNA-binding domain-containing protein [Methylococcaceae bacterium]